MEDQWLGGVRVLDGADPRDDVDTACGAATSIRVAPVIEPRDVTGRYFRRSRIKTLPAGSRDRDTAEQLWHASTALVGAWPTGPADHRRAVRA